MLSIKVMNLLHNALSLKQILDNAPASAGIYCVDTDSYIRPANVKYELYDLNGEWAKLSVLPDNCIDLTVIQAAYNKIAPVQPRDTLEEYIVCAANKDPDNGVVYPCVRHGCEIFWGLIDDKYQHGSKDCMHFVQGFLTNKYRFVDRYEAYEIATKQNQIRRLCPTGSNRLYSEMLY